MTHVNSYDLMTTNGMLFIFVYCYTDSLSLQRDDCTDLKLVTLLTNRVQNLILINNLYEYPKFDISRILFVLATADSELFYSY